MNFVITIDGPTASGKSTVAQCIAQKLGINHLNSGLIFRAVAYLVMQSEDHKKDGFADIDGRTLAPYIGPTRLRYHFTPDHIPYVLFDGVDREHKFMRDFLVRSSVYDET